MQQQPSTLNKIPENFIENFKEQEKSGLSSKDLIDSNVAT